MDGLPDLHKVLNILKHMSEGDARVDRAIMLLLGFRLEIDREAAIPTDLNQVMWAPPFEGDPIPEPRCTMSIDEAYVLARIFIPNETTFGAAWEPGLASAKIDGGSSWEARIPQAALCIALLHYVLPMSFTKGKAAL